MAKLEQAQQMAQPYRDDLSRRQRERQLAERDLVELRRALDVPFSTAVGRRTDAYRDWLLYTGAALDNPRDAVSLEILMGALKSTGALAEIRKAAILAWINDEPGIRDETGIYRADGDVRAVRQPDGSTVYLTGLGNAERAIEGTPRDRPMLADEAARGVSDVINSELAGGVVSVHDLPATRHVVQGPPNSNYASAYAPLLDISQP